MICKTNGAQLYIRNKRNFKKIIRKFLEKDIFCKNTPSYVITRNCGIDIKNISSILRKSIIDVCYTYNDNGSSSGFIWVTNNKEQHTVLIDALSKENFI